jgi:PIN domain nuclease of toxin-antitoxin system
MKSPILLDTCAALWIMESAWLQPEAVDAIDAAFDHAEQVHVSPITGWEIGLLASKGKFKSSYSPQRWLDRLLSRPEIAVANLPPEVLLQSSLLPGTPPRDPADRIIAATAREYGFTVMTRDRSLLAYSKQGHLSAIEC